MIQTVALKRSCFNRNGFSDGPNNWFYFGSHIGYPNRIYFWSRSLSRKSDLVKITHMMIIQRSGIFKYAILRAILSTEVWKMADLNYPSLRCIQCLASSNPCSRWKISHPWVIRTEISKCICERTRLMCVPYLKVEWPPLKWKDIDFQEVFEDGNCNAIFGAWIILNFLMTLRGRNYLDYRLFLAGEEKQILRLRWDVQDTFW